MTEILKSCPFCGGEAAIVAIEQYIQISCTQCEIVQKSFFDPFDNKRQIEPAIKHWNQRATRTTEKVLEEVLEEARAQSESADFGDRLAGAISMFKLSQIIASKREGLSKDGG